MAQSFVIVSARRSFELRSTRASTDCLGVESLCGRNASRRERHGDKLFQQGALLRSEQTHDAVEAADGHYFAVGAVGDGIDRPELIGELGHQLAVGFLQDPHFAAPIAAAADYNASRVGTVL